MNHLIDKLTSKILGVQKVSNEERLVQQLVNKAAGSPVSDRFLLQDKRSGDYPDRKKLSIKEFKPHFDAGPTYFGIIDTSRQAWLAGHEYSTRAAAERALKKLRSGRARLKYRGF